MRLERWGILLAPGPLTQSSTLSQGRLLQSIMNAMDEYEHDSDNLFCHDMELLQYQRVHCSDDGKSLLMSVYNDSVCSTHAIVTAEVPMSSAR